MPKDTIDDKLEAERTAIQDCEEQVLHKIGYIQPFAHLLAYKIHQRKVTHASKFISVCFNQSIEQILGQDVDAILPKDLIHRCNNACAHSTISSVREYIGRLDNSFEIYAHVKDDFVILEFQAFDNDKALSLSTLDAVQRKLGRLNLINSPKELFESAVIELKNLCNYDRVKIYQFLPDGSGEVIAEEKEDGVDSFLGLRFPAFDIPKAARELYAKTPIRVIPDVFAEQVDVLTTSEESAELDLSLAISRGAVPVHMMYLQNMGVSSTLSIPIVIEGKMWGLFACHHYTPRVPSADVISSSEIMGNVFSMMLAGMLQRKNTRNLERCNTLVNQLIVPDDSALGFTAYWDTSSTELATLINCDGIVLASADSYLHYGECPSFEETKHLVSALTAKAQQENSQDAIVLVESIKESFPALSCDVSAGFLAIPNPIASFQYLLFFRNEAKQNLSWAGSPTKELIHQENTLRLNPRASFAQYIDTNKNRCLMFSAEELNIAEVLKDTLHKVMSHISTHTKNRSRLGLMVRELNHRVRNTLALITSIVSQARNDSHSIEQFIVSLESRIQALSETHKLLTEFNWEAINISLLFERSLSPYLTASKTRFSLKGPAVFLPPELASLFALVAHELASNAVKYGALSVPEGKVLLEWQTQKQHLHIKWREQNGPSVTPPERIGFGTTLIKEALSYEFDALCDLQFLPTGVEASFVLPHVENLMNSETELVDAPQTRVNDISFDALLLEDDFVISQDMTRLLKRLGAKIVDASPSLKKAKMLLETNHYDLAVLDANIRGEFSGDVARCLDKLNIPYIYVTGYGSNDQDLASTNCVEILTKPISEDALRTALNKVRGMQ